MNVKAIAYRMTHAAGVQFNDYFAPQSSSTADFSLEVTPTGEIPQGLARFSFRNPVSEAEARELAEQYLCSWRTQSLLKQGYAVFDYSFESAVFLEPPDQDNAKSARVLSAGHSAIDADGTVLHIENSFPPLPLKFLASEETKVLARRYERHRIGQEPLQAMAYWILSTLEHRAPPGKGVPRARAASHLRVEYDVLNKLGDLTANAGDETNARKGKARPMTRAEERWIDECVRRLILRAGEIAFDPSENLREITFKDFPAL